MNRFFRKSGGFLLFLLLGIFFWISRQNFVQSVPPTNVKDTLSSSQLSYFGRLAAGNVVNSTTIKIGSAAPSLNTNNLFVGDTLGLGSSGAGVGISGPLTLYTVRDIGNTVTIELNAGIGQSNAYTGTAVIATRSAIHTVDFTPKGTVGGDQWQFLIKATSRAGENQQDGIPDQQGFDLGATTPSSGASGLGTRLKAADVSCPWGGTASVGTTAIISGNSYHVINCALGAGITNPIDVGATMTIGRSLTVGSQLINPAPAIGHTEGQADNVADVYTFFIRHLDNAGNIIASDTASGRIAVVESVRVTATVDPTISFSIGTTATIGVGTSICGVPMSAGAANITATSVPFGSLNLNAFNNLAQYLTCVTNAPNGYVVTVYETDTMQMIGTNVTIPDTNCDSGPCTTTLATGWTGVDPNRSEFGYSLQNINAASTPFNSGVGSTIPSKPFGIGPANAQTIMSNPATPTTTEAAYVCYRLTITTNQQAGNYENQIVYTATATF